MKNHKMVDGKLLQTNKKYSHLKQKQKNKIYQWMYEAYADCYKSKGKFPDAKDDDEILYAVMRNISKAEIWIPEGEVRRHYNSVKSNLRKRLNKSLMKKKTEKLMLQPLEEVFSVCKVEDYSGVDLGQKYIFTGSTDEELSLVCPVKLVPGNTTERDDGWRGFRIKGELDFSLIGILARISKILAVQEIGIFAISTFNTDYILVKEDKFDKAIYALKNSGYQIEESLKSKETDNG